MRFPVSFDGIQQHALFLLWYRLQLFRRCRKRNLQVFRTGVMRCRFQIH